MYVCATRDILLCGLMYCMYPGGRVGIVVVIVIVKIVVIVLGCWCWCLPPPNAVFSSRSATVPAPPTYLYHFHVLIPKSAGTETSQLCTTAQTSLNPRPRSSSSWWQPGCCLTSAHPAGQTSMVSTLATVSVIKLGGQSFYFARGNVPIPSPIRASEPTRCDGRCTRKASLQLP